MIELISTKMKFHSRKFRPSSSNGAIECHLKKYWFLHGLRVEGNNLNMSNLVTWLP